MNFQMKTGEAEQAAAETPADLPARIRVGFIVGPTGTGKIAARDGNRGRVRWRD